MHATEPGAHSRTSELTRQQPGLYVVIQRRPLAGRPGYYDGLARGASGSRSSAGLRLASVAANISKPAKSPAQARAPHARTCVARGPGPPPPPPTRAGGPRGCWHGRARAGTGIVHSAKLRVGRSRHRPAGSWPAGAATGAPGTCARSWHTRTCILGGGRREMVTFPAGPRAHARLPRSWHGNGI